MTKKKLPLIIGILVVIIIIFMITTYNRLVKKDENVVLQWNEVQNVYQRRLQLIPNLVNVVKGVSQYEQGVLTEIADARAKAAQVNTGTVSAGTFNEQTQAQDQIAISTNRLLLSLERYPELQGTRSYKDLQTQLEGTERRIKVARKDFNTAIADYNSSVKAFPTNLIAGMFGFKARDGFKSDAGAENSVEIKF